MAADNGEFRGFRFLIESREDGTVPGHGNAWLLRNLSNPSPVFLGWGLVALSDDGSARCPK